jgi:membrane protein implicated in regulation of membrane protease activity
MLTHKMTLFCSIVLLGVALGVTTGSDAAQTNAPLVVPVRSAKQARQIGESALVRKYGKAVQTERPFHVKLEGDVWRVTGTTYCQEQLPSSGFYCPESHWVRISTQDGHIVAIGMAQSLVSR